MSPKTLRAVNVLNRALQDRSWKAYLELFSVVVSSNDTAFCGGPDLYEKLRSGRIAEAVAHADSLVEQSYSTATEHFVANQLAALVRKYDFPSELNTFDPEEEARKKFLLSEQRCAEQNRRMRDMMFVSRLQEPLHRMRSYIQYLLGTDVPLATIYEGCGFGPGAAIGTHGNATNLQRKLLGDWTVGPGAYYYARTSAKEIPTIWGMLNTPDGKDFFSADGDLFNEAFFEKCRLVDYNKIAFVPKTVKTYRSIAVEPLWNSFIQKGVDSFMRKRLKRAGLDLSDQSSNSEWARLGSLPNQEDPYVTIDLSAASDSISIEVVRSLLPPDWFDLLNSTRSAKYSLDDSIHRYEKFCSMGNGFCFPLETLIFASACIASGAKNGGQDFLVYGDDIVVRQSVASRLIPLLEELGFSCNTNKTFLKGPFRESCGRDWFEGEDVRPYILDCRLDNISSLFKFINLCQRNTRTTAFFLEARTYVKSLLPKHLRFARPVSGPDDTAYTCDLDEFLTSPFARWNSNLCAWSWKELLPMPCSDTPLREKRGYSDVLMYAALLGSDSRRPFTLRRKSRTRVRAVSHSGAVSTWLPATNEVVNLVC